MGRWIIWSVSLAIVLGVGVALANVGAGTLPWVGVPLVAGFTALYLAPYIEAGALTGHGGTRTGAGRPAVLGEDTERVMVRLSAEQAAWLDSKGDNRAVIDAARAVLP